MLLLSAVLLSVKYNLSLRAFFYGSVANPSSKGRFHLLHHLAIIHKLLDLMIDLFEFLVAYFLFHLL